MAGRFVSTSKTPSIISTKGALIYSRVFCSALKLPGAADTGVGGLLPPSREGVAVVADVAGAATSGSAAVVLGGGELESGFLLFLGEHRVNSY